MEREQEEGALLIIIRSSDLVCRFNKKMFCHVNTLLIPQKFRFHELCRKFFLGLIISWLRDPLLRIE